jgi:GR25 family glycosyltransferase involved in LPS biosynthesis
MKSRILTQFSFFSRLEGLVKSHKLDKSTINLVHRLDKWDRYIQNCNNSYVRNFEKFNACEGKNYNKQQLDKLFKQISFINKPHLKNLSGVYGCAISHYNLWLDIVNINKPRLIMEDDVSFCPQFIDKLGYILNSIENIDYDIVFIGYHANEENVRLANTDQNYLQQKFGLYSLINLDCITSPNFTLFDSAGLYGGGTFGYIMSVTCAKKMITNISNHKFLYPVDYQIVYNFYYGEKLNIYLCSDPLLTSPKFGVNTQDSDIQN